MAGLVALLAWASISNPGLPGGLIERTDSAEIGIDARTVPDFSVTLLDSETQVSDDSLRGKVVMVDFWSSWCPPCRYEAPVLAKVYKEYDPSEVEFLGIALWDGILQVSEHIRDYGVTYPNALDGTGTVAVDFGVRGLPEKFFVDPDGKIVKKYIGPLDAESLRRIIDGMLESR